MYFTEEGMAFAEELINVLEEVLDEDIAPLVTALGQHGYFQQSLNHATRTQSRVRQVVNQLRKFS